MAERKVKVSLGEKQMDGFDVPVEESSERWSEYKLEDGGIIRIKTIVVSVIRAEGEWDQEGNPLYIVKSTNALTVVEAPHALKRKTQ